MCSLPICATGWSSPLQRSATVGDDWRFRMTVTFPASQALREDGQLPRVDGDPGFHFRYFLPVYLIEHVTNLPIERRKCHNAAARLSPRYGNRKSVGTGKRV